jgi:hypothetical protein
MGWNFHYPNLVLYTVTDMYKEENMRTRIVLLLAAILILGSACGRSFSAAPGDAVSDEKMAIVEEAEYAAAEPAPMMDSDDGGGNSGTIGDVELPRMIIYNGSLDIVVKDTTTAQDDIVALVEGMDGYVVNVSSYAYGGGLMNVHLTVRVPADAFNAAMASIRNLAMDIRSENVSSQDVTQEYVDLESRLRALEVKADRLEVLMDEAEDTEAVLAVYQELALTQQHIEETKGRMRYLERSSAMATIEVQLTPDAVSQPVEVAGWRPQGTMKSAIEALIKTFQWIIDVLLWVILYIAPVLIVVVIVVFIVFKILGLVLGGRRRKQKSAKTDQTEDTEV